MARITQQDIKNRLATRRRKLFSELSKPYKSRIRRAGITPAQYNAGRVSLQRARGHKPAEHITRRERNPESPTSSDYRFLKGQQKRFFVDDDQWAAFVSFYYSLSISNRQVCRNRVYSENKEYKKRKGAKLRKLPEYISELKRDYPWFEEEYVGLLFYH